MAKKNVTLGLRARAGPEPALSFFLPGLLGLAVGHPGLEAAGPHDEFLVVRLVSSSALL